MKEINKRNNIRTPHAKMSMQSPEIFWRNNLRTLQIEMILKKLKL